MTTTVQMVIISHLSDLQIETGLKTDSINDVVSARLKFIKYLINKYTDTTELIDPEKEYEIFNSKR